MLDDVGEIQQLTALPASAVTAQPAVAGHQPPGVAVPEPCPRCRRREPLHTLVDCDHAELCCAPCLVELLQTGTRDGHRVALLVTYPIPAVTA